MFSCSLHLPFLFPYLSILNILTFSHFLQTSKFTPLASFISLSPRSFYLSYSFSLQSSKCSIPSTPLDVTVLSTCTHILKGIISRDFVVCFLVSFYRSEVCKHAKRVCLLLKFRFRVEFSVFRCSILNALNMLE
jgi:hypothetical protein